MCWSPVRPSSCSAMRTTPWLVLGVVAQSATTLSRSWLCPKLIGVASGSGRTRIFAASPVLNGIAMLCAGGSYVGHQMYYGSASKFVRDHGPLDAECQLTAETAEDAEGFRDWR